ncbi:nitrile hydratase subunit beta [soil metagenome]
MGGLQGYGPVVPEPDEPYFHAEWEKRALALTLAAGIAGGWNIDMTRSARETLPPADYLRMSYYEIWIAGLSKLLARRGMVGEDEIVAGRALRAPVPAKPVFAAAEVPGALARGWPTGRPSLHPARFAVGDRVRTKNMHPATHTRLPRYVRGHIGRIERVHGAHVFPDTNALGEGETPQWLYTMRFAARELWGEGADPAVSVSVDAWEPYLESA